MICCVREYEYTSGIFRVAYPAGASYAYLYYSACKPGQLLISLPACVSILSNSINSHIRRPMLFG